MDGAGVEERARQRHTGQPQVWSSACQHRLYVLGANKRMKYTNFLKKLQIFSKKEVQFPITYSLASGFQRSKTGNQSSVYFILNYDPQLLEWC